MLKRTQQFDSFKVNSTLNGLWCSKKWNSMFVEHSLLATLISYSILLLFKIFALCIFAVYLKKYLAVLKRTQQFDSFKVNSTLNGLWCSKKWNSMFVEHSLLATLISYSILLLFKIFALCFTFILLHRFHGNETWMSNCFWRLPSATRLLYISSLLLVPFEPHLAGCWVWMWCTTSIPVMQLETTQRNEYCQMGNKWLSRVEPPQMVEGQGKKKWSILLESCLLLTHKT